MYYYNTSNFTQNFYFTPVTPVSTVFTRNTNYIWTSDGSQIDEYSLSSVTPTFVRTINLTTNNIEPYGMYYWANNKLLISQGHVSTNKNQVIIIDISTSTATTDSVLFTLRSGRIFQTCNIYRKSNITYLMDQNPGGANSAYEAYYDNGILFATGTTNVNFYGACSINNQLYAVSAGPVVGALSAVTQSGGLFTYSASPYTITNLGYGVSQSPNC
jgi:hypothetical protein